MRLGKALGAAALVLASASPVAAHSLLLDSSPAAASTVAAPHQLTLRFNNRIEKPLSRLRVVNERGAAQTLAVLASDGPADRVTAALPALAPGAYRVEWQVLSTDGHIVSGSFAFTVAP